MWLVGWLLIMMFAYLVYKPLWSKWEVAVEGTRITSVYDCRPDAVLAANVIYFLGFGFFAYGLYVVCTLVYRNIPVWQRKVHLVVWTIGPPLFFLLERFWLFPQYRNREPGVIEAFAHGQETARYFWAAFLALFISLQIEEALKSNHPENSAALTGPHDK
jgi:hypothetical protein